MSKGNAPMTTIEDLAGRVAVVTGGGSGLGAAIAHQCAAHGMSVAVLDIDEPRAAEVAASLETKAMSVHVDVGDPASVQAAADEVTATFGHCHLVCANVGVQQFGAIERLTEQDWQWVLNVNVMGPVRTVQAFLPLLRAAEGWRQIALTSSSSVFSSSIRHGAYTASKYAVMGLGDTLRLELADEGIGVTVVFPAGMMTRHLESSALARPAELGPSVTLPDDIEAMLASRKDAASNVATAEHAVRNLLTDLVANEPFHLTHGSYRDAYEARLATIAAAFDRLERS